MTEKKKKVNSIVLSVLGILSLVLITAGVTVAVFTYTKLGTTENTITVGSIEFLYTENSTGGHGITLTNALPVEDQIGKNYTGDKYVFDFKVEGTNSSTSEAIPYEVTLREVGGTDTLDSGVVKVYLTDANETTDPTTGNVSAANVFVQPTIFDDLTNTTIDVGNNIVEKTLYTGAVPVNSTGDNKYTQNFRLRMWIDNDADFSPVETTDPNTGAVTTTYPYNSKTFTGIVNVYSNVTTVNVGQ